LCSLWFALSGPAEAQQPKKTSTHGYRAGDPTTRTREAFRQGLHELGWVEGHNITVDYRWAEARPDWLSDLAGWKWTGLAAVFDMLCFL